MIVTSLALLMGLLLGICIGGSIEEYRRNKTDRLLNQVHKLNWLYYVNTDGDGCDVL